MEQGREVSTRRPEASQEQESVYRRLQRIELHHTSHDDCTGVHGQDGYGLGGRFPDCRNQRSEVAGQSVNIGPVLT